MTSHITPIPASVNRGSVLASAIQRADDQYRVLGARLDALSRPVVPPPTFEGSVGLGSLLQRDRADRGVLSRAFGLLCERTVADQVTTENAGVVPPSWLVDVLGRYAASRPAIQAFGGPRRPDDATGTGIAWPYRTDSNTAIGVQGDEKTEVTSVRVDIGQGTAELATYAGAADISLQLLQRSSGAYLDAYAAALATDHATVTDAAFAAALTAGGTVASAGWDADATGRSFLEALLAASAEVQAASGQPGSFALAATDVWTQLPRLSAVVGPGTTGGPGWVDAPGLGPVIHVPGLATGEVIVSNPVSACWVEDGPYSGDSPDPTKLGRDVAFYSVAVGAILVPKAVRKLFGPGASGS